MSITEWNPWSDFLSMRDAMDELMRSGWARPRAAAMGLQIPVDVYETNNDFIIFATMPGVDPSDVHIQVQGNTVRITGDMKEEMPPGETQSQAGQQTQQSQQQTQQAQQTRQPGQQPGTRPTGHWLLRERRTGHFVRVITLPTNVESNEAKADFRNGTLIIHLPKAAEARAKAIPIRSAAGQQQIEAQSRTH
ncbi:Hsp20/alpha crystallin family protein [Nitrolancea hollandica]|uniref:Heat shock protein Hsp20 n=1 Tax=Nitrolancea hollandica Lb TaxID=1129897 RepID=I4EEJ7_9BACT|nr:Hsp20/alpha crystallin family protein [Nitrolancea hollandica]CCF83109.1 Heat shock protein Hsp20 [Nitrolancea hollandica Lb]